MRHRGAQIPDRPARCRRWGFAAFSDQQLRIRPGPGPVSTPDDAGFFCLFAPHRELVTMFPAQATITGPGPTTKETITAKRADWYYHRKG